MRKASLIDVQQLVTMMAEFYSDSPYTLNPRRATEAFTSLLADDALGMFGSFSQTPRTWDMSCLHCATA